MTGRLGAPPQWCQTTPLVLGRPLRYSEPLAPPLGRARLLVGVLLVLLLPFAVYKGAVGWF